MQKDPGTPYVILLNNDTETDKYFVEWLLRGIKKSDHIFSCGAQMIDYKNHEILDNAGIYILLWDGPLPEEKADHVKIMKRQSGCFRAVPERRIYRMDIMRKIGGLDEKHFAYLEDVDLGYRARIAGFENWYIPRRRFTMSEVRQRVHDTIRKRYFSKEEILFCDL